jgi:hypothetical protein
MTREQAIDEATKVWRRADITTGGSIIQILEKLGLVRFRASSRCRPRVTPCRTYKLTVTVELIDGGKLRRGGHLPRGGRLLREHRAPGACAPSNPLRGVWYKPLPRSPIRARMISGPSGERGRHPPISVPSRPRESAPPDLGPLPDEGGRHPPIRRGGPLTVERIDGGKLRATRATWAVRGPSDETGRE